WRAISLSPVFSCGPESWLAAAIAASPPDGERACVSCTILPLLKKLWVLPVDIRLSALNNHLRFHPRAYSYVGSVPMLDIFD
ncbi:hypothetical protein, partial [Brucella melitensis]|uniref:hypothetical protein n=1 Tax=Brucella melitensis TaxID=29459 RepID=UPI003C6C5190